MRRKILEYGRVTVEVLRKKRVDLRISRVRISLKIVISENSAEICFLAVDYDLACREVHIAVKRGMNTAEIDNKLVIDIEPEVVVSGKLEYYVMSPRILFSLL